LADENDAALDNANSNCSGKYRAAIFKGVGDEPSAHRWRMKMTLR
jgi:hypothetical protein